MQICPIISNYQTSQKSNFKTSEGRVSFSRAEHQTPIKKALGTKLESLKLNLQRIISDYKWNKFMKEINNDVDKMPKSTYPTHYDFRNHT